MQAVFQRVLLSLIFLLPFGCERVEPPVQSQMHQVLGALQIPDKTARESALAAACHECAAGGDVESVLLGIPSIADGIRRENVAEECFEMLVAANKKEAAGRIVELIKDPARKTRLSAVLTVE